MADGFALPFTPAVEAATAPLWEKVRTRIDPVEWRLQAPLIAAINDLKAHLNAWRRNRRLSVSALNGKYDAWLGVALPTFQRTYGLPANGVCDKNTWAMIHKITKGAKA